MRTLLADIRDSGKRKWLLVIPFLLLAILVLCLNFTRAMIDQVMLREKFIEIQDIINILGDAVDASTEVMPASEEVRENTLVYTLRAAIESLDGLPYIYGALYYEEDDGKLTLLTKRAGETEYHTLFDVSLFPEFNRMIEATRQSSNTSNENTGRLRVPVYNSELGAHDMDIFFRFTPSDFEGAKYDHHRFLLVGGVTKYSIQSSVPTLVFMIIWIMIISTVFVTIVQFSVIIRQALRVGKIKDVMVKRVACSEARKCPLMHC